VHVWFGPQVTDCDGVADLHALVQPAGDIVSSADDLAHGRAVLDVQVVMLPAAARRSPTPVRLLKPREPGFRPDASDASICPGFGANRCVQKAEAGATLFQSHPVEIGEKARAPKHVDSITGNDRAPEVWHTTCVEVPRHDPTPRPASLASS